MCLPAYRPCLCCFETIALGFVPNKIPRDCVILLMGLWALWAYSCCFGTFALGFAPNKISRNCVILLMDLWALWAYFYLAFALRLLRQVPLHLGFLSCHDLGLGLLVFPITTGSAGMTIHKPLYLDFMESPVVLGLFILSCPGPELLHLNNRELRRNDHQQMLCIEETKSTCEI